MRTPCELQVYRAVSDSSGFDASATLVVQSRHVDGKGRSVHSTDTICIGQNASQLVGEVADIVERELVPVMDRESQRGHHVARSRAKSGEQGPMVAVARVRYVNGAPEMVPAISGSMDTVRPPIQLMRNGLCCRIAHGHGSAHVYDAHAEVAMACNRHMFAQASRGSTAETATALSALVDIDEGKRKSGAIACAYPHT
jgi:hypothetical protein